MAEHGTLAVGDTVTHPDWPESASAKVLHIAPFKHWDGAKRKLVDSTRERIVTLDKAFMDTSREPDDAWMEGGLIRVDVNG